MSIRFMLPRAEGEKSEVGSDVSPALAVFSLSDMQREARVSVYSFLFVQICMYFLWGSL